MIPGTKERAIFEQTTFSNIFCIPLLNRSSARLAAEPASSNFKQDQFGKAFAEQFSADQMERAIIHTTGGLHSFYLWLLAQKTFCLPSFIFYPDYSENFYLSLFYISPTFFTLHCDPLFTKRFLMAITHKNNLPLVMDLNVSQAYATSVSPKIWRCRWAWYTAIIVSCGKHNCCLCWVKRTRGNIIQRSNWVIPD